MSTTITSQARPQRHRLEDFISLARSGVPIRVHVALRRQRVTQRVHPANTESANGEVDAVLLLGEFAFEAAGGALGTVTKVYALSLYEAWPSQIVVDREVANARFDTDLARLRSAGVSVTPTPPPRFAVP